MFDFGIVRVGRIPGVGWRVYFRDGSYWLWSDYDGWHRVWSALDVMSPVRARLHLAKPDDPDV